MILQVVILQEKLEERDAEIKRLKLELQQRNVVEELNDSAPNVTEEPQSAEVGDVPQTEPEQS